MHQRILILDFGSQFTQLIARRIREIGVYCEIHPGDIDNEWLREQQGVQGIILSGGHASVADATSIPVPKAVFELGKPVLGICYGMQAMAHQLGGQIQQGGQREYGLARLRAHGHTRLLDGIQDRSNDAGHGLLDVWMSHADRVTTLPDGFVRMGSTAGCDIAAMADEKHRFYGLQFHPEVTHTPQGRAILARFIIDICGCSRDWNMPDYMAESIAAIRRQVGSDEVILGLSGGVDSSVAAALIHQAIGDQLTCVFVDHGLLRMNEAEQVMQTMAKNMGIRIVHIRAAEQFMGKLAGIADPETKRKTIGREFVEVFQQESARRPRARWLAQGTIYPDVIESAGGKDGKTVAIKSHHNVGGLPETLNLKLLEPLRELFKDEVRKLGLALGLPADMVFRHPFPGPGLGVRILGEIKPEYIRMLRQADDIFIQELRSSTDEASGKNWYELTSQAFVVFLPVKSVGVMGDGRTYEYAVALRAVQTTDFMTADWAQLPYDLLQRVSTRIINEVPGINRVTYDVSSKPPATIEWE